MEVFYFNGNQKDTVSFIKVDEDLVKDAKLGYKYVSEMKLRFKLICLTICMDWHQINILMFRQGRILLYVQMRLELKQVSAYKWLLKDDKYGYGDGLVRNVYRITDGKGRYLTYDGTTKKYMMKTYPTDYFLKENNDIEGKEYYTLVEANLRSSSMNQTQAQAWYPKALLERRPLIQVLRHFEAMYTPDGGFASYDGYGYLLPYAGASYAVTVPIYDKDGNVLVADNSKVDYYNLSS